MVRRTLACVALAAALGACASAPPIATGGGTGGAGAPPAAGDPGVDLGDMQTLLGSRALGLDYFPDEGTSILSYDPFRVVVTDGLSRSTVVLAGAAAAADPWTALPAATASHVLAPCGGCADFDNGYIGVSAVYRHTDGTYYGFYHAEDQVDTGTIPGTSIPGFYARIGLAVSADGVAWTRAGYVIESATPKRAPDGVNVQYDQGAAEPGAIVSPDGRYLYLYYTEHSRLGDGGAPRPVLICMARADLAAWPPALPAAPGPMPGVFTKYHAGSFSTDGIGGADSPVIAPPTATSNALEGHVAYSASLGKLVMVYGVDAWMERSASPPRATVSGLYVAFSDDGIAWRRSAAPILVDFGVAQPGLSVSWQASILWDRGADTTGWLIYGYSPSFGAPGHYMVGRRITLRAP